MHFLFVVFRRFPVSHVSLAEKMFSIILNFLSFAWHSCRQRMNSSEQKLNLSQVFSRRRFALQFFLPKNEKPVRVIYIKRTN